MKEEITEVTDVSEAAVMTQAVDAINAPPSPLQLLMKSKACLRPSAMENSVRQIKKLVTDIE